MADEYIRKQDAVNAINEALKRVFTEHVGEGIINPLEPADVAPVVRCKDCLFFTTGKSCCRPEGLIKAREDAFCSYGERKEDNE